MSWRGGGGTSATGREEPEFIFVGYAHASIIGAMRPEVAYPDRKIRAAKRSVGDITAELCLCDDDAGHVEVWVKPLLRREVST
jgi:hypothetical protein